MKQGGKIFEKNPKFFKGVDSISKIDISLKLEDDSRVVSTLTAVQRGGVRAP